MFLRSMEWRDPSKLPVETVLTSCLSSYLNAILSVFNNWRMSLFPFFVYALARIGLSFWYSMHQKGIRRKPHLVYSDKVMVLAVFGG